MKTNNESDTMELLLQVYLFFKKFIILILIFLVMGVGYGIYKNKTHKTSYTKEILVYSEDISYILLKQFTISLSKDIDAVNYKEVSAKLFVDEAVGKSIVGAKTDSVSLKGRVYALTVFTFTDSTGIGGFAKNYVRYLSSVDYIRTTVESNKLRYTKILAKLDQKLKELDALQENLNAKTNSSSTTLLNDSYREYVDLYSKKMDYEEKINSKSGIEIIRQSSSVVGARFGLLMGCIIYGMIFFVMSLAIGFFIELLGKIIRLEQRRK